MKIIELDIDEDGNVSLEGKGFEGTKCEAAINKIINMLGIATGFKRKISNQRSKTSQPTNKTKG